MPIATYAYRSLAGAPTGASVRIGHIPLRATRDVCADLGLLEGDRVQCVGETERTLMVWTEGRHAVLVTRAFAGFIPVEQPVA